MKMKNERLFVPVLVLLVLGVTNSAQLNPTTHAPVTTITREWTTGAPEWTTEPSPRNLHGKMFTLSAREEGTMSLYHSYPSPPWFYSTSTYPPWTTAPPNDGVSVCLRFITDYQDTVSPSLFTLSPQTSPLQLAASGAETYRLSSGSYAFRELYLKPNIRIRSYIDPDIWTRVCLIVDTRRDVVQVFSGPNMSIRKILSNPYVWSGESTIVFSGFDGQVTDVQVWDYPLRYAQVYNYMTGGVYTPYRGSVISWSHATYSVRGKVLLEEAYKRQGGQLDGRRGRGRQLKRKMKKSRRVFSEYRNNEIEK